MSKSSFSSSRHVALFAKLSMKKLLNNESCGFFFLTILMTKTWRRCYLFFYFSLYKTVVNKELSPFLFLLLLHFCFSSSFLLPLTKECWEQYNSDCGNLEWKCPSTQLMFTCYVFLKRLMPLKAKVSYEKFSYLEENFAGSFFGYSHIWLLPNFTKIFYLKNSNFDGWETHEKMFSVTHY